MKTLKSIAAVTGLCLAFVLPSHAQWTTSGTNIYNSNTGNIGMGTTAPLQKLHVAGNVLINGPASSLMFGESATTPVNGEWGIEYEPGGLNFWKPWLSNNFGNFFLFLKDNGNVGIGTNNPIQHLDVNGRVNVTHGVIQRGGSAITTTSDLGLYSLVSGNYIRFVTNGAPFKFFSDGGSNPIGSSQLFSIESDGRVLIGTSSVTMPAGYKLYVQTGILTEKIKVAVANSANWSDYVFAADYKLKSLTEVEKFIATNKHLPNIPSAEEVVKEGIDLGKMDAKLLEKIEELTLYLIEQDKKISKLNSQNNMLQEQLSTLLKK